MRDQGVELGAHTRTHLDLAKASKEQLQDEIAGSAERIAFEAGRTPTAFAYPYGSLTDAAVGLVATRFAWGCTTEMRSVGNNEARALLEQAL